MSPISHENSFSPTLQWLCKNIYSFQLWTDNILNNLVYFQNALGGIHFDLTELMGVNEKSHSEITD